MITLYAVAGVVALTLLCLVSNVRVIQQFERGVVYRFGQVQSRCASPG